MSHLDEYLRDIEQRRLPALRRRLIPLESGERTVAERKSGGPWIDAAQERIEQLRIAIAEFKLAADKLRNREAF
jgi:hypothetical protein